MAASSGSSLPIRAPLTLDTDSDYESSGLESEDVFESGDEFETASEQQFVADPDEESSDFGERNIISGPFVAEPDDTSVEGSSLDGEDGAFVGSDSVMPIAPLSVEDDEFDEAMENEMEDGGFSGVAKVLDEASEVQAASEDDGPVGVSVVNQEVFLNEGPELENFEATIERNSEVGKLEEVGTEERKSTDKDVADESMGGSENVEGGNKVLSDKDVLELIFGGLQKMEIMNDEEQEPDSPSYLKVNSDEDMVSPMEGRGEKMIGHAAFDAFLRAATGVEPDGSDLTPTLSNASRVFSLEQSNLSDSSFSSSGFPSPSNLGDVKPKRNLSDEEKVKLDRMQHLRVKFLRLVHRLGCSANDSVVARVLYKLEATSRSYLSEELSVASAKKAALQLEAEGKEDDLDFNLNILVLGKTGVGKSATINSLFCEERVKTGAFDASTTAVKVLHGTINGLKIRIIDTPGLRSYPLEEPTNRKILASVKKFMRKFPPDVVLYVDRLDINTRDLSDLPLLKSITKSLGSSLWGKTVVTLTHASSDGLSGLLLNYEVYVAQRSRMVQQTISKAVGNILVMNPDMMHPVCLVENHAAFQKDKVGDRLLPNGQSWRPQLLLLCYSLKILSEASSLSKHEDSYDYQKLLRFRQRSLPLSYQLSTLLQSRPHPSSSADNKGGIFDAQDSDLDGVDDDEYDQLPPFKPLTRSKVSRLSKEQRKAYFEEYDYRVKLLEKKQLREEIKRSRELKKKKGNEVDEENDDIVPESIPVPLPDLVLPPSFDGANPVYRYRSLEPTSSVFLTRPVLESHGWDHDPGYDGVSVESNLAVGGGHFPSAFAMQIRKDKEEFDIHLNSSVCAEHGVSASSMAGLEIQTIRKQLAYVLRGETKLKNFNMNETAAGVMVTLLGETVATGLKIEDQIVIGKHLVLGGSGGTVHSQGDAAFGANLEIRMKDCEFPLEQDDQTSASVGVSVTKWRGDLNVMANLQSEFCVGRGSKMSVNAGMNNHGNGKISFKISCSDHLELALGALIPTAISIFRNICFSSAAKVKH